MSNHVTHCQVSSKKRGICKACKNNFRCRCGKFKADLHDICFERLHGY